MKKFMLIASITALLSACGGDDNEVKTTAINANEQPQILTYIPADTPLLMTSGLNPEQYPDRYVEVMQGQMDGAVKYLQVMLDNALTNKDHEDLTVIDENGDAVDTADTDDQDAAMKQKTKAFVERWFIEDKFAKVGMKMGESQFAVYMIDLFPVIRVKLSANHQVPAMLDDLEQQFPVTLVKSELNGSQVREIQAKDLTLFLSLQDDYLVISGAPTVIKDQMIGELIGSTKPSQSLAQDSSLIQQIKQAHGYTMDDILLFDIQRIADHFINPAKHNSKLVNFMQIEDNMLSAVCKDEITAMLAKAPRMVAGSKALTNDTIHATFVWEMDKVLSADLATLAGRIPRGNDNAAMSMGFSFDLLNAKNLASKYVDAMVAAPFACEHFAQLNQKSTELQAKLSQPLPPFVGNFKGFNFSLDELKLNIDAANAENPNPKDMLESLKTQIFLAVDETEALLGMAQMMMPQLQEMAIKTDGSLITLADKVPMISGKDIPIDIANLYAAVSADTIGLSLGHEDGGSLEQQVKEPGQAVLISFSAHADGYKSLMEQIFAMAEMPNMPAEIKQELATQKSLALDMLYWKTQDMTVAFTDEGFTTDIMINY